MRYLLRLQDASQYYWTRILEMSRYDPLRFVEVTMLGIASLLALLLLSGLCQDWPFLSLTLSYTCGASCSVLVRESLFPSPWARSVRLSALLALLMSAYGFFKLRHFLG